MANPHPNPKVRALFQSAVHFDNHNRTTTIGASEVAGLMGVTIGRFVGPFSIWQRKRGIMSEESLSGHAARGLIGETMILQQFAAMFPDAEVLPTTRLTFIDRNRPNRSASPDAIVVENGEIAVLDAKWPGTRMMDEWGSPEDPEGAPLRYRIQVQAQMSVLGVRNGILVVPLDLDEWKFGVYRFDWDQALEDEINGVVDEFWTRHVLTGEPPAFDSSDDSSQEIARRWPARPGRSKAHVLEAAGCRNLEALFEARALLSKEIAEREFKKDAIDAALKDLIGDRYGIRTAKFRASFYEVDRATVNWRALAEKHEITEDEILEETTKKTSRVLRVTGPKPSQEEAIQAARTERAALEAIGGSHRAAARELDGE